MDVKVLASSSKGNCTRISDGVTPLLLDAGLPLRQIRERLDFGVSQIGAALITHSHQDHCRGVADLLGAGLACYMLQSTAEALGVDGHHRTRIINPRDRFQVGTWRILAFDTPHDVENLGFLMVSESGEKALHLTDTPYCKYRFQSLNYIMVECNYDLDVLKANVVAGVVDRAVMRRTIRSHMSLQTCLGFLRANDLRQVRQIWLLHLSDSNSDSERFKTEVQRLTGKPVTCC